MATMKPMESIRIGGASITLTRVDERGAMLAIFESRDEYVSRALTPEPMKAEQVLLPLPMWRAFETLLALVGDLDKLQALLFREADWPKPTGDERTDLIAQRSAALSKLNDATNAVMAMTWKVKG